MSAQEDRQSFVERMEEKIRVEYQCDAEDVTIGGLNLGTTWVHGQDYSADYDVDYEDGRHYEGQVFWSSVGQEVHF
jgi:hypothetical protein